MAGMKSVFWSVASAMLGVSAVFNAVYYVFDSKLEATASIAVVAVVVAFIGLFAMSFEIVTAANVAFVAPAFFTGLALGRVSVFVAIGIVGLAILAGAWACGFCAAEASEKGRSHVRAWSAYVAEFLLVLAVCRLFPMGLQQDLAVLMLGIGVAGVSCFAPAPLGFLYRFHRQGNGA